MNKYFYFLRLLESTRFFDADYEARMWVQEFVERGGDIEYELELCREVGVTVAEVFETACSDNILFNDPYQAFSVTRRLRK